jgi:hypothetical protein
VKERKKKERQKKGKRTGEIKNNMKKSIIFLYKKKEDKKE